MRRWCVGWTGHRTIPNEPAVTEAVLHVLETLTTRSIDATMERAAGWIGIGSAAIGADLIVAEACIQRGIPLRIVLPCSVDHMLAITPAEHKVGCRTDRARRAKSCCLSCTATTAMWITLTVREIASVADVLIAVWDGSPARGPGGTADVIKLSKERGAASSRSTRQQEVGADARQIDEKHDRRGAHRPMLAAAGEHDRRRAAFAWWTACPSTPSTGAIPPAERHGGPGRFGTSSITRIPFRIYQQNPLLRPFGVYEARRDQT